MDFFDLIDDDDEEEEEEETRLASNGPMCFHKGTEQKMLLYVKRKLFHSASKRFPHEPPPPRQGRDSAALDRALRDLDDASLSLMMYAGMDKLALLENTVAGERWVVHMFVN